MKPYGCVRVSYGVYHFIYREKRLILSQATKFIDFIILKQQLNGWSNNHCMLEHY